MGRICQSRYSETDRTALTKFIKEQGPHQIDPIVFRVIEGNTQGLADVDEFIGLINDPPEKLRDLFNRGSDIYVSRAPGRLDVMGGIADYSGSLVLEMPIGEATFAAVQKSSDSLIRIVSLQPGSTSFLEFEMSVADLATADNDRHYESAREFFVRSGSNHWASYIAGVFFALRRELGAEFINGSRILISSRVPIGKGVSSSAALEVATMQAICGCWEIQLDPRELAILCQKVENYVVGAACGVMDQITGSCGTDNALLSLLCQPAEIIGHIDIPDKIEFWGIDSGVRHSVAGSDYSSVRVGAFMGYRIIADITGCRSEQIGKALVKVDDDRWGGYLANISTDEFEREFESIIPIMIKGDEFLRKYGGITDSVTTINNSVTYAVRAPTMHAVYESSRVKKFVALLNERITEQHLKDLGRLMFESHESYSSCGLTEPMTDRIVELVRAYCSDGIFGARITGGGSGGTVAVLAKRNSREAIENLLRKLERETGYRPYVFHGSSPGAAEFGNIRLRGV